MGNFFNFNSESSKKRPAGRRRIEAVSIDRHSKPDSPSENSPPSKANSALQNRVLLRLSSTEVKLLSHFCELLSDDFSDSANPRLYPKAHLDDKELQEEFADLTSQDLKTSHQNALNTLVTTISDDPFEPITYEQLGSWVASLSVLRLALGAKLEAKGITLDTLDEVLQDSPDQDSRFQLAAYLLMADILEEASQFMLSRLASELDEGH